MLDSHFKSGDDKAPLAALPRTHAQVELLFWSLPRTGHYVRLDFPAASLLLGGGQDEMHLRLAGVQEKNMSCKAFMQGPETSRSELVGWAGDPGAGVMEVNWIG